VKVGLMQVGIAFLFLKKSFITIKVAEKVTKILYKGESFV